MERKTEMYLLAKDFIKTHNAAKPQPSTLYKETVLELRILLKIPFLV